MSKKYELTNESIELTKDDGSKVTLYRIKALKDFCDVKEGELGGWVESEDNLSQEGTCWVYEDAEVYGNARVYNNAIIYGNAEVYGNAIVYNNVSIYGKAKIYGNAEVDGNARVHGSTEICGDTKISNNAAVYGMAKIFDNAEIFGYAKVYANALICGKAEIFGNTRVCGNAYIHGDAKVYENAEIYGKAEIYNFTRVSGIVCDAILNINAFISNITSIKGYKDLIPIICDTNCFSCIGPVPIISKDIYITVYYYDGNIYVVLFLYNSMINKDIYVFKEDEVEDFILKNIRILSDNEYKLLVQSVTLAKKSLEIKMNQSRKED